MVPAKPAGTRDSLLAAIAGGAVSGAMPAFPWRTARELSQLRRWLSLLPADRDARDDVLSVAVELGGNSLAYRQRTSRRLVRSRGACLEDAVQVTVAARSARA